MTIYKNMNQMKTFVIINHYILNEEIKKMALETIKSFRDTSDVIICSVDDGSPVDTDEIRQASDYFARLDKNSGFAISANKGLRFVLETGKLLAIIAQQTIFDQFLSIPMK